MKIDDATYERIMDETPVPDLDPTWRVSSFRASKKWCEYAHHCGIREGYGIGLFAAMIVYAIVNTGLVLFEVERGWPSAVVPGLAAITAVVWAVGKVTYHRLYMYGKEDK